MASSFTFKSRMNLELILEYSEGWMQFYCFPYGYPVSWIPLTEKAWFQSLPWSILISICSGAYFKILSSVSVAFLSFVYFNDQDFLACFIIWKSFLFFSFSFSSWLFLPFSSYKRNL